MFRPAASPLLFSALVGTGSQLAVVVLLVILFAILGELYTERGSLLSTSIFMYAATAPLNGYFGGSLYARSALQSYHDCLETLWDTRHNAICTCDIYVSTYHIIDYVL